MLYNCYTRYGYLTLQTDAQIQPTRSTYLDVTAACLDLCQQTASSGTGL